MLRRAIFLIAVFLLIAPARGFSTIEYGEQTGKNCELCPTEPGGGSGNLFP